MGNFYTILEYRINNLQKATSIKYNIIFTRCIFLFTRKHESIRNTCFLIRINQHEMKSTIISKNLTNVFQETFARPFFLIM